MASMTMADMQSRTKPGAPKRKGWVRKDPKARDRERQDKKRKKSPLYETTGARNG